MKKKRRRTAAKSTSQHAPAELAFTKEEEAFFSAGASLSELRPIESFEDLDDRQPRPSLLRRLFSRRTAN
jgi:hypothetical protein